MAEVIRLQPDLVLARDPIRLGLRIDRAHARPTSRRIVECAKPQRHQFATLDRDHGPHFDRALTAQQAAQVVDRAVAEVTRVFDVERNRRRAAQFVADVLGHDRDLVAALRQTNAHDVGQQPVQVHGW